MSEAFVASPGAGPLAQAWELAARHGGAGPHQAYPHGPGGMRRFLVKQAQKPANR